MIRRRFIVYQKHVAKPVVITDDSDMSDQEVATQIRKCFTDKEITQLSTEEDILFLRPSEITAIMVHKILEKEIEEVPKTEEDLKITDNHVDKK